MSNRAWLARFSPSYFQGSVLNRTRPARRALMRSSHRLRDGFAGLDAVQLGVEPPGRQQFVVGATLGEVIVLHHEDGVGVQDRIEMVGDDDRGLAFHQTVERLE